MWIDVTNNQINLGPRSSSTFQSEIPEAIKPHAIDLNSSSWQLPEYREFPPFRTTRNVIWSSGYVSTYGCTYFRYLRVCGGAHLVEPVVLIVLPDAFRHQAVRLPQALDGPVPKHGRQLGTRTRGHRVGQYGNFSCR